MTSLDLRSRPHVVVLGGGFSAAALAVHLARSGALARLALTVVDPTGRVGRGAAYDAEPEHLLNVPAARMSLLPDVPEHFLAWARARHPAVAPGDFLPRRLYGDYVEDTLRTEVGGRFTPVRDEARAVTRGARGWDVTLAGGTRLAADVVVLATGNAPPAPMPALPAALRASDRYVASPWRPGALDAIAADERVLVLGTGLTLLDVLATLRARGHHGTVVALSRRGVLPAPHAAGPLPAVPAPDVAPGADLLAWVRAVRASAAAAEAAGGGWQAAVDALRPLTSDVWAGLSPADRRRFAEHLRPWWDAHRHRAPREALAHVADLRARGALAVRAGRLVAAEPDGRGVVVGVRPRGADTIEVLHVDRVVNATGPDTDLARSGGPLYADLLARGHVTQDALRLGLLVDPDGAALDPTGTRTEGLYVLGGARRAQRWENTAVPELRVQARALAEVLGRVKVSA